MMQKSLLTRQRLRLACPYLVAALALAHFAYFLIKPWQWMDLRQWERTTCYFSQRRDFIDDDCRYFHTRRFVLAQPHLNYGERLNCQLRGPNVAEAPAPEANCPMGSVPLWGYPQRLPDIGWDAHALWYGRAAMLYFRSLAPDWPGLNKALRDPAFVRSFPNREHYHYPWLLPVVYWNVLKIQGSSNPAVLIGLQVALFLLVGLLYHRAWPHAPPYLWIAFAFVPMAGAFLLRLYADLWVVAMLLLVAWGLERQRWFLWALASAATFGLKQEAYIQWLVLMSTWIWLRPEARHALFSGWRTKIGWGVVGFSLAATRHWSQSFYDHGFYVGLGQRLREAQTYTHLIPQIAGYYLDVLIRPKLWGVLWPLCFYIFYHERARLRWAILPLAALLLAIPVAFLSFPGGHKEVVLTGSGRALWQALPTLWLMLKVLSESPRPSFLLARKPLKLEDR